MTAMSPHSPLPRPPTDHLGPTTPIIPSHAAMTTNYEPAARPNTESGSLQYPVQKASLQFVQQALPPTSTVLPRPPVYVTPPSSNVGSINNKSLPQVPSFVTSSPLSPTQRVVYSQSPQRPQLRRQGSSASSITPTQVIIMPSHNGHSRQYVLAAPGTVPTVAQLQQQIPMRSITPYPGPQVLSHPSVDRHRRDAAMVVAQQQQQPTLQRSQSSRSHRQQSVPAPPSRSYVATHRTPSSDSEDSDHEFRMDPSPSPYNNYGSRNALHGVVNPIPAPISPQVALNAAGQPVRPALRHRTTSQASSATVHFNPDNLFVTFPSPHILKISNIPRFGTSSLLRALRERVFTLWLPGIEFQKEGKGELIVGFAGLGDNLMGPGGGHDLGLSEMERRNWGIWTARGLEGITYVLFLTVGSPSY